MTLNTILFFSMLTIFTSCNGQKSSHTTNGILNNENVIPILSGTKGDTVSEIDKSIWYIFQDKHNNFWFGSNGQGVYRYDGQNLIHFTYKEGLCNDHIRGIQEDRSGNIYFNTISGISKFDGKTFTTLKSTKSDLPNSEWRLHPDDLWFQGAQDSGVVYRYDGISLHRLQFPKTKAGEEFISKYPRSEYPHMVFNPYDVYSIYKDSQGNIWFGTGTLGVCRYEGKAFTWISENGLGESPVRSIIEDKNGNFWFGNSGQAVYRYDARQNDSVGQGKNLIDFRKEKGIGNLKDREEDTPVSYMSITEDNNGELWIATYEAGVWRYNPSASLRAGSKNVTHYPIKDGDENVMLFSIYKDNQGNLWLGTHTAGAYKFNGKTFEKFRP